MNILVLNGSPKGNKSNTFRITSSFLDGLNSLDDERMTDDGYGAFRNGPVKGGRHEIETVEIGSLEIGHCLGCYTCWTKTPGRCVLKDDMAGLLPQYVNADLVIWSFPLYFFGMPSKIKAFMDRLLPLSLPVITVEGDGTNSHPSRYDLTHQRHLLISTCGFYSAKGNYDGLIRQFEILFGDRLTKILCPEGELFRVPELSARIGEYLSHVKKAGREYSSYGAFTQETQNKLEELLYPPDVFIEMANADWEMKTANDGNFKADEAAGDRSYPFLRQMAALYHPDGHTKDLVLEMHFTDLGKTYQLMLGKEKCTVKKEDFSPYTTRIETSFETWLKISKGEIDGAEALMNHLYKVLGDFSVMTRMDELFGSGIPPGPGSRPEKSSNMALLLLPYLTMWILTPFDSVLGGAAGILAGGLVMLLHFHWLPTPYERIGAFTATAIGLLMMTGGGAPWQAALPSLAIGIIWLVSSFLKVPVTAYYSCRDYGGKKAWTNPLFIKTNRILTAMWSIAYLLWGLASLYVTYRSAPGLPAFEICVWVITALLGVFTAWFAKWYPAKVAKGP